MARETWVLNASPLIAGEARQDAVTEGNRIARETGQSEQHASMSKYRRAQVLGARGFLPVNLSERSGNRLSVAKMWQPPVLQSHDHADHLNVLWYHYPHVSPRQAASQSIHAKYAEFEASIGIDDGEILAGKLPRKQLRLVQAWIELHHDELMADRELAIGDESPYKIAPL